MHKMFNMKSRNRSLFLGVMIILLLSTVFLDISYAVGDEGVNDLSLYQRASEIAKEFATALAPGTDVNLAMIKGNNNSDRLNPGNAGGLLGYAHINSDDKGVIGWLTSSYTASSATITYDQLKSVVPSDDGLDTDKSNPFFHYAGYGEALSIMGLSKSLRPGGIASLGRMLATFLTMLAYLISNIAPFLFKMALSMLDMLNPFKLFLNVTDGVSGLDLGILSGIADYVGDIYKTIQGFSVAVLLPALIVSTLFGILVLAKGQTLKRLSRYAVIVFMMFAGLPLIGATYTGIVENLNNKVEVGSDYADYLILSSYVDFENWVRKTRLAPPESILSGIVNPRVATDTSAERMKVTGRDLVLEVNGTRAGNKEAVSLRDRYKANGISDIFEEGSKNKSEISFSDSESYSEKTAFRNTFDILTRHMTTSIYTGSQFDGEVSGQIQGLRSATKGNKDARSKVDKDIARMFILSSSDDRSTYHKIVGDSTMGPIDWKDSKGLFTAGSAVDDDFIFGDFKNNIYNGGSLTATASGRYKSDENFDYVNEDTLMRPIGSENQGVVGGLSPLAMYNFLNTTFTKSGLTIYSPEKSSSDISRDAYASVSFASSGVTAFTRWTENFIVMLSISVLSIAFGVMMMSIALTNIPRILSGVFGTAFGSMAFITKLLISTGVMIVQILGMIFLYFLSENIIMSILLNFSVFTASMESYFNGGGIMIEFARSSLTILVTVVVTYFMIKNMKIFREMMEEVVSGAINRIMGVLDTSTGGAGMDISKNTGGRIGGDGHLTEAALAGGAGGIAGLMAKAHHLESEREELARDQGKGVGTMGDKIKRRMKTASGIGTAQMKDKAKGIAGFNGRSEERELASEKAKLQAMRMHPDSELSQQGEEDFKAGRKDEDGIDDEDILTMSGSNQKLDEDGNMLIDDNGDAEDADGNPVSPMSSFDTTSGSDGIYTDLDGNEFKDEAGNVFKDDANGNLINDKGEHVALDSDGTLQPIESLGIKNPVSAKSEAQKLSDIRSNADDYVDMKNLQDGGHHGISRDGQAIGKHGEDLTTAGINGEQEPLSFDNEGYLVNSDGDRVDAKNVRGDVDSRAYDKVENPETGEINLQHKGDESIRSIGKYNDNNGEETLDSLAKQANRDNAKANNASERVEDLRAVGASPYAIRQAERYAEETKANAEASDKAFAKEYNSDSNVEDRNSRGVPVSPDQIKSANRETNRAKQALQKEQETLDLIGKQGASPEEIATQEGRISEALNESNNARAELKKMQNSGASVDNIKQQRSEIRNKDANVAKAQEELKYMSKPSAYTGSTPEQIASQEGVVSNAVNESNSAKAELKTMKQNGSPVNEIREQEAKVRQSSANVKQAQQELKQMTTGSANPDVVRQENRVDQQKAETSRAINKSEDMKIASETGRSFGDIQASRVKVERATSNYQKAQSRLDQAVAKGAPQSEIDSRQEAVIKSTNILSSANEGMNNMRQKPRGSAEQIDKANGMYQKTKGDYDRTTRELNKADEKGLSQKAKKSLVLKQAQAKKKMDKANDVREQLLKPKGPSRSSQATNYSNTDERTSFANLARNGVTNYDDYSRQVDNQQSLIDDGSSQINQLSKRLRQSKKIGAPPQVIQEAEAKIRGLKQDVKESKAQLKNLQDNAHGLLKFGGFKPPTTTGPIRVNGAKMVNELISLSNNQTEYDNLVKQKNQGVLTKQGNDQMVHLKSKLSNMRDSLVKDGVDLTEIQDVEGINNSSRHIQQSWDNFIKGKENSKSKGKGKPKK